MRYSALRAGGLLLLALFALLGCSGEEKNGGEASSAGATNANDGNGRHGPKTVQRPSAVAPRATRIEWPVPTVDLDELRRSAKLGAAYLVQVCLPDGRFVYRINFDPQVQVRPKYNIVRHAGAIYSLAMYHERFPDEAVKEAAVRAGKFLHAQMAPIKGKENLLAVWSRSDINGSGAPDQAKLGGSGLGLVALLALEKVQAGATPRHDLQRLGSFLVYMQKDDGGFYSKYIPSFGGRDDRFVSLYYPGEAALGLLMLHELDGDARWRQAALDALLYLARIRRGREQVEPDHWALLASELLLRHDNPPLAEPARRAILDHARQVCRSLVWQYPPALDDPRLAGSIGGDGRTTPTATRLEGLLAALEFLPPDDAALRQQIERAVAGGLAFLLRAQVKTGDHAGAMPRAVLQLPEENPYTTDSFNSRVSEVRIDYMQHPLSAMLQYLDRHR